jgi:DNA-binding SARP family transcriptional activator
VQVFTLGGFRVVAGGHVLTDKDWRRKSARQLFKALLSRPGRRMTRDEVIELLWPESDLDAGASNLRSTVHAMRRALEPSRTHQPGELGIVFGDRDGIWLRPDLELWVDADEFERAVDQAANLADPSPLLRQASSLYVGDYLPDDLYEDWASGRRQSLKLTWTSVQLELARLDVERDQPEAALGHLQRLLKADRCDERAAQELMQVLLQLRRRSEVLRVFQNLERALQEELGVAPSERSLELFRMASASDEPLPGSGPSTFQCSYTFPEPKQLVGRETELARLLAIVERARTTGQFVLISAPAGTGKSALAGAVVKRARRSGVLCLAGAAYDQGSGVPLAAFQEAFTDYVLAASVNPLEATVAAAASELIEAVRNLRTHPAYTGSPRADASEERSRLFSAMLGLLRRLADRGPVLVCLEDLQAADIATLQLLHFLVRQTRRLPAIFLCTVRTEALQPGDPLMQIVAGLEREHLVEKVELADLGQSDTERLVSLLVGGPVSGSLSTSIFASTDGNPLFVEQLILSLQEDGRIGRQGGLGQQAVADFANVPVVVRELIEERLLKLSPRGRQTLAAAAVLGHIFDYLDLLTVMEPADESTLLEDLDEAIRAQLLQERSNAYAFAHALVRDGVYLGLSRPRRMLLHGRIGEVLEKRAGATAREMAAQLAHHFVSAGLSAPFQRKALDYSLRAGGQAAALASHREALRHFEAACEVIERSVVEVDLTTRIVALEGRGMAQDGMGLWPSCVFTFRAVLDLATEPTTRALARRAVGFALHHMGNTREALAEIEAGIEELGPGPDQSPAAAIERLQLQHQLALLWYLQGRFDEVLDLGVSMVKLAGTLDDERWMAWAQNVIGWAHNGSGRMDLAVQQYELTLAIAEHGGSKLDLAGNHTNLGIGNYRAGRFSTAQAHLEIAISLYRETFGELRGVLALHGLGFVHLAQGNLRMAQEYADLAVQLASDAQDRWLAEALEVLGALQIVRAEWEPAWKSFERSLEIHEQVGEAATTVGCLVHLGQLEHIRGRLESAQALYERALSAGADMTPAPQVVAAHRRLALLRLQTDDGVGAATHIQQAQLLAERMQSSLEYAPLQLAEAQVLHRQGNLPAALALFERVFASPSTLAFTAEAHAAYAAMLLAGDRVDEASSHADTAVTIAEQLGAPVLIAAAFRATGLVAAARSDYARAASDLETAQRLYGAAQSPEEQARAAAEYHDVAARLSIGGPTRRPDLPP